MAVKGVGAECGEAGAIVFLDFLKDFLNTRRGGFVGSAKFRRRISWRCARERHP
jgi:hypothetical protein